MPGAQERPSGPLELELRVAVSHLTGALGTDHILCEENMHSYPLSYLSGLLHFGFLAHKHVQTILNVVIFDDVISTTQKLGVLNFLRRGWHVCWWVLAHQTQKASITLPGTHFSMVWLWAYTLSPGHFVSSGPFCFLATKWTPQEAFNQTQSSSLLRDPVEGKNSTNSTRTLRLPDTTGAAWYILTIIGIYGLIFIFRLASNILRRNERSLEDVYCSDLPSELKRKGFQSRVAQCPSLITSNASTARPGTKV